MTIKWKHCVFVLYHINRKNTTKKKKKKENISNWSDFRLHISQRERASFQVTWQAGFPHSGCPSVPRSSALLVFVHPRTVDIDCVGDRPRHISTPLAPATEKHINWLHREPCLVTMAKHTGREEECWDGAAGSPCSLPGVVSHSFAVLQPCLSHTQLASSILLSALFTHINTICIFPFLTHSSYYWCWPHQPALATHSTPLSNCATLLSACNFFPSPPASHLPLSL